MKRPGESFAQRAHVVTEYPASTLLIDDYFGFEIQFDSLDDELGEYTFTDAQENRLLVFVGDEILSVWGAELLGVGRYRLWTIRARYDTRRNTHPVDAEVWVVLAEDLPMRADVVTPPERFFKLQPFLLQSEYDLAEIDPVSETFQRRAYRPLAPLNLRVAGDGHNPTYPPGGDIVADWDKSWRRSANSPVMHVLATDIDKTVLEVWTMADVLAGRFEFTGDTGPKTVTNAQLVAALGSETDFEILTAEIFKQEPTYVSGVPTTIVGPPTTGSYVLSEVWKDALGGASNARWLEHRGRGNRFCLPV